MMSYREENVAIQGKYQLQGTLEIPIGEGPFDAVLVIAGSGSGDRDGNFKAGKLFPNIYKNVANYISSLGFITLRVDKRGCGESSGNFLETGLFDLVDDILSSIEYLKNHPLVEKVILLGHSEGATLIAAANARCPVDGLVFLSGGAESLPDALVRQRELAKNEIVNMKGFKGIITRLLKVDEKVEKQAKKLNDKIMASNKDVIKYQFQKINAKWFREHYQYDVFEDLKKVECPSLAINGDKDIQITPDKAHDLSSYVKGPACTHVIENMDHLLKEVDKEAPILSAAKAYKENQDKPMHPVLELRLKEWLEMYYPNEVIGGSHEVE